MYSAILRNKWYWAYLSPIPWLRFGYTSESNLTPDLIMALIISAEFCQCTLSSPVPCISK